MNKGLKIALSVLAIVLAFGLGSCAKKAATAGKVTAGFVYIGPPGDMGWTNAHDIARKALAEKYKDWLVTEYVESVNETAADVGPVVDKLVNEKKCQIIFTTSFGYMDPTVELAAKYPDVTFEHCSGYKSAANLGTYFADLYQTYYAAGLMAGALTKSGKAGYVGAFPTAEVLRHINSFALGMKAANPKATVSVRWISAWYAPDKAREAALALLSEGCDVLTFTEDSSAVIEVAQESTKAGKQVYAFSHYSPMLKYGPDCVVSGELADWTPMYDKMLSDFKAGTWKSEDLFWRLGEGVAILGADLETQINPKFIDALKAYQVNTPDLGALSAYDLVQKRMEQMTTLEFEPFTGPIADQKGNIVVAAGAKHGPAEFVKIDYLVDNVKGEIPASN